MSDIEKLLEQASDNDPKREHDTLWAAIYALAEEAGYEVPPPLTARKFTVTAWARWPRDHEEKQVGVATTLHDALISDWGVGEGKFLQRTETRRE
ncbi:hypothetical protein SEA_BRUHMOMENT_75 [Arthrobacter phage BruhMoment]|nr:hypothetical protein SEA_BRUHMOMENT_75 [Arthrobacter phage BruhMoment]